MAQPTRSFPSVAYRVICTTEEVIWLDLHKPGVPAFRMKHYRDNDDTLALQCGFRDGVCHTFLWSRKTSALTVYTTPALGPFQLLIPAYNVDPPTPDIRRSGLAILHAPNRTLHAPTSKKQGPGVPEALLMHESAADGTVYQREFMTGKIPVATRENPHGRLEHKRLNAAQPLSHLPLEDPKAFKVAHLFMLYNSEYTFRRDSEYSEKLIAYMCQSCTQTRRVYAKESMVRIALNASPTTKREA